MNAVSCNHPSVCTTYKGGYGTEIRIICKNCGKELYFFHSCKFDYHEPCPVTEINDKEWYENVYLKCKHESQPKNKRCTICGNSVN